MKFQTLLLAGLAFATISKAQELESLFCDTEADEEEECGAENRCCYYEGDDTGTCWTTEELDAWNEAADALMEAAEELADDLDIEVDEDMEDVPEWSCNAVYAKVASFAVATFAVAQLF